MVADGENFPVVQGTHYLDTWDVHLTILTYKGRQWFVMAQICALLGIKTDAQVKSLSERELMAGDIETIPVQTSRGIREPYCIALDAVGTWMIIISDRRVRKASRPNLLLLQRDIKEAARRAMFGMVDAPAYATREEVHDLRRYTWFLERQIIEGQQQQQHLLLPESDDEPDASENENEGEEQ